VKSRVLVDDLNERFPEDTCVRFTYLPVVRAIIALDGGHSSEAIELLKGAEPYDVAFTCSWSGSFGSLYSPYVRGEADLASHRYAGAPLDSGRAPHGKRLKLERSPSGWLLRSTPIQLRIRMIGECYVDSRLGLPSIAC
jgi:hypothetical protein